MKQRGAIILCGGKSSRMGSSKALLPFGEEVMLLRVVRLVSEVVSPDNIVVVAAMGQELPPLPSEIRLAHDAREDRGPLEGLAAGLRALPDRVDAAFVTGCDVPLLVPAFVEQMFKLLGDHDIAVPVDGKYHHPLAAVYRTRVLKQTQELLDSDRLRPTFLFELAATREVPIELLRETDAELASLVNCNRPEDYQKALRMGEGGKCC